MYLVASVRPSVRPFVCLSELSCLNKEAQADNLADAVDRLLIYVVPGVRSIWSNPLPDYWHGRRGCQLLLAKVRLPIDRVGIFLFMMVSINKNSASAHPYLACSQTLTLIFPVQQGNPYSQPYQTCLYIYIPVWNSWDLPAWWRSVPHLDYSSHVHCNGRD